MAILGKVSSLKASSHYFTLILNSEKLVIYSLMGNNLISRDILCA